MEHLSPDARYLLEIAAMGGADTDHALLKTLFDQSMRTDFEASLSELVNAHYLEVSEGEPARIRSTSELVRQTVASTLPSAERARIHADMVESLVARPTGQHPELTLEIARHAVQGVDRLGNDRVAGYCLAAAEILASQFDWAGIVDVLRSGLSLIGPETPPKLKADLHAAYGMALVRSRDTFVEVEAVQSIGQAMDYYIHAGSPDRALQVAQFPFAAVPGRIEAIKLLEKGLELAAGDPLATAGLLNRLSVFASISEGDSEKATALSDRALAMAEESGDQSMVAVVLSGRTRLESSMFESEKAIETATRALEIASVHSIDSTASFNAHLSAAHAAMFLGRTDDATHLMNAAVRATRASGDIQRQVGALWLGIRLTMDRGDFDTATDLSEQAFAVAPRSTGVLALRAWIEYERSNPASGGEFLEQLHSIEAVSRSNAVFGLTPWDLKCQVLGYVYQITGDHSMLTEAEAVAAGRAAGPDGNLFQQFTGFNAVAALAAISGDRFRAAALLAEYERVAAQYDVPDLFALAIAGLHRTLGDTRKATDFYERALEYNRKSEFALMSAYASFDFTGMLIDIGDAKTLTRARNVLHTAIGLA
ncbi:MAG: hypothetical protein QF357_05145, partial [Dehalococcoidia bacterium]|nr:hypothetical protein [Dehalococcoidia bacterium]